MLHLTRAASPQFVRPIFFRLIRVRAELHTYDGWTWLDGYQLNERAEAAARRELFVLKAGVRLLRSPPLPQTGITGINQHVPPLSIRRSQKQ